jgi:hypothetical protein
MAVRFLICSTFLLKMTSTWPSVLTLAIPAVRDSGLLLTFPLPAGFVRGKVNSGRRAAGTEVFEV